MREGVFNALVELVGDEEKAKEFAALVDDTNRAIDDEDLITREGDADDVTEPVKGDVAEPDADQVVEEIVMDDQALDVITSRFNDAIAAAVAPLMERLGVVEASVEEIGRSIETVGGNTDTALSEMRDRLDVLETDEQEKLNELKADLPRRQPRRVTYRPRQVKPGAQTMDGVAEATLSNLPSYPTRA